MIEMNDLRVDNSVPEAVRFVIVGQTLDISRQQGFIEEGGRLSQPAGEFMELIPECKTGDTQKLAIGPGPHNGSQLTVGERLIAEKTHASDSAVLRLRIDQVICFGQVIRFDQVICFVKAAIGVIFARILAAYLSGHGTILARILTAYLSGQEHAGPEYQKQDDNSK